MWWTNTWYSLWKTNSLAKDNTRYSKNKDWTNSERTLCDDYKEFVHFLDRSEFNKRIEYLRKAGDIGRTPLPTWMLLLLAPLLIAEGLGFSYLLGTWMAMEGSENTHTVLMIAIVFVLATILLFVTHQAGHQLYRSNLIKRCNKEWRDDGQPGKFQSKSIGLNDAQLGNGSDDNEPHYTQCVNRVGTSGSYVMVGIAIASIIFIAVASTYMRVKHQQAVMTQETVGVAVSAEAVGNPFASAGVPSDLAIPQAEADNKGKEDANNSTKDEGLAAFLMLAFIFVVTQIVGISAGYKWGFAGKESKKAYGGIYGFSTYEDFVGFYEPIIQTAQAQFSQSMKSNRQCHNSKINPVMVTIDCQ